MIPYSSIESFKLFAEMQVNIIPGGVAYFLVEGDKITWKCNSNIFDIPNLQVGVTPSKNGGAMRAISEKRVINDKIPRNVYGVRIKVTSVPVTNEIGEIVGAISIAFPRVHPIAASFENFAPIFAEMFPEGVFIYLTDLESIIKKQSSSKFDIPGVTIGYKLKETDLAYKTITTGQKQFQNIDASRYGVKTLIINFPLYDEDDNSTIVGTMGVVVPKGLESQLFSMSHNIKTGMSGITGAITELADSATQIHENELLLHENINEVFSLTDEINTISAYIKKIADQTNMLGLNAAIEASRAGEVGRGFSVVADEIRKLSENSRETAPKINSISSKINSKMKSIEEMSQNSLSSSQTQAATTQEITASVEEITSMIEELDDLAKEIS